MKEFLQPRGIFSHVQDECGYHICPHIEDTSLPSRIVSPTSRNPKEAVVSNREKVTPGIP